MKEKELLELIARFYSEQDLALIKPHLHSNIQYASAWVLTPLIGTNEFLRYFEAKIKTMIAANVKMVAKVSPLQYKGNHFFILEQNGDSANRIIVEVKFKQGRIFSIYLSPEHQAPFTFQTPAKSYLKALETMKRL